MLSILQGFLVASFAYAFSALPATTTNEYARQQVFEEFNDTPALLDVAFCESSYEQYMGTTTIPKRGVVNNLDVGVMQINEKYHLEDSKKLGFDIYTVDGNIGYAKYLYSKYGLKPWSSSFPCMNKRAIAREDLTNPIDK